ncbi:putative ATP-dependent helicase [Cyphellophora attinorum]|uniref:Putative ATP-dependent helicase n=1 Tax=Cyphellophora attinorum TaxID=1664694 RepID=A0A0N1NX96_9EURO|nr:putative ATP-dependent helicase [Phialophora attinorum]KPI36973.1 putative ATP-dependent helicase [Phialophora attinorum]
MASTPEYRPSYDEIPDIQEDIELNVGLLASLNEAEQDSETEESKKVIARNIKRLKKRLAHLTRPEQPSGGPSTQQDPGDTAQEEVRAPPSMQQLDGPSDSAGGDGLNNDSLRLPVRDFVSRKRQRGDFDDELETGSRGSKSIRASPNLSSGPSPAPSGSLDEFDLGSDGFLNELLSKDELEAQRKQLAEFEERREREKRQLEADEEFARALMASDQAVSAATAMTSATGLLPPASQRPSFTPLPRQPVSSSQTFLRGDGSFRQPPPPAQPTEAYRAAGDDSSASEANTPASEDSLAEIPASQFVQRMPSYRGPPTTMSQLGPSMPGASGKMAGMPGAFPGAALYSSTPGMSVYGQHIPNRNPSIPGASYSDPLMVGINAFSDSNPYGSLSSNQQNVLDRFGGIGGWDDYADPAKTQEEIKNLLKHIRPDEDLSKEQLAEMPQGLSRPLMPHQVSGLAWMKKMEEGTNKGGILADDMGLGKTLQAIALMLARPAPDGDRRPNLIVAPVALMEQWKREIRKFCLRGADLRNVVILHGQSRATQYNAIRNCDVVITTYGTLGSELKRRIAYDDKCKHAADPSTIKENCAILGTKSKFHRVFLDEAQNVKNRNTISSRAACSIVATHRWALTGTPMQNNVEEMYSLIKFCRIRPFNDWDKFSRDIARPIKGRYEAQKTRAMTILQGLLRAILLRRTKQSKIDGKPILQLPSKTTVEDRAIFGKDQREFYEALEKQAQIQFNRYLRNNSVGRNYSHALVLLLRLRQACCHPTLIVNSKDFSQTVSDLAPMDMVENAKALPDNVVDRLKQQVEDGFECPVCMDANEDPTIFPCGHGVCTDCFARLCENAVSNEEGSAASCPHCRAKIDANKITNMMSFLRVYCPDKEGVEPLDDIIGEDESDTDGSDDEDDSDDGADLADFIVADDEEVEYEDDKPAKKKSMGKKKKVRSKGKGKEKPTKNMSLAELRKQGLKSRAAKKKYLKRLAKDFESSAKIDKTIALLEEIHARGEGEKTIVFSSFTSFLDLLEVPLSRHPDLSIYSRYDGSMGAAARNDAVLNFTDKPNNRVILVSLKAGNAGLNLTAANHVILLDPFWNPFVEYQAADRCYRIGQEREVTIHRLLIGPDEDKRSLEGEYTVEDRILKLQEKKRELVETALDENAGSQLSRLGVRELGYLFGVNNLN